MQNHADFGDDHHHDHDNDHDHHHREFHQKGMPPWPALDVPDCHCPMKANAA